MGNKTKAEFAKQLEEAGREVAYYKRLIEENSNIRLRETEELSRLITDLKETQKALQKAQDELEKRVEERTAELVSANLVLNQEILRRSKIEAALRESEKRFRSLAETISDWVWEVDRNGVYTYSNPKVLDLLGYEPAEVLGKQPFDFMPREEQERIGKIFKDLVESRKPLSQLQNINLHKDGRQIILETSGVPVFDEGGHYAGHRGIDRDVSERRRMEEALQQSEERFRSLSNASFEGIMIHDQGVILDVNLAFTRLFGYEQLTELIGKNGPDFLLTPESQARIRQRRQQQEAGPIEVTGVRKDGTTFEAEAESQSIKYLGHDAIIVSCRNITDRKKAEGEKAKLEAQLQRAQKIEAIGTLAGGIAHDFNNLLMGIQGYASLMLLDLDPSHPYHERLKRIEEQVQSGADLTRQLLGFARGGRYDVKSADMNDILDKSSSMFGRTKKEISIHRKYGKDLWPVEVDRGQMDQVFMNLYVNAWQAMPGGGEIYLETEDVLLDNGQAVPYAIKPGKYVKITVTDTGAGMDEKTRERIFDPFFTTKEMGRGTGLGLATVYGIIKGHKGMINVYSEPGHGTTFTIYLPASDKEVVKEKTATETITGGTETILLVDDEKMVMEVSKELLESMGYRVYAACNGQEAIAVYREKRNEIDLVLLDMIMPGISGGETFDRLREINPEIRVLLSSGYSISGQAQEILNRGCNGFIQKPFRLQNISQKVRETLS